MPSSTLTSTPPRVRAGTIIIALKLFCFAYLKSMTAEHISAVIVKTQESDELEQIDTAAVPARCAVGNDVAEGGIAIDVTDEFGDIVVSGSALALAWTKGSVTGKGKKLRSSPTNGRSGYRSHCWPPGRLAYTQSASSSSGTLQG